MKIFPILGPLQCESLKYFNKLISRFVGKNVDTPFLQLMNVLIVFKIKKIWNFKKKLHQQVLGYTQVWVWQQQSVRLSVVSSSAPLTAVRGTPSTAAAVSDTESGTESAAAVSRDSPLSRRGPGPSKQRLKLKDIDQMKLWEYTRASKIIGWIFEIQNSKFKIKSRSSLFSWSNMLRMVTIINSMKYCISLAYQHKPC